MAETIDNVNNFDTVALDDDNNALLLVDQTRLPHETVILALTSQREVWEAIRQLRVRGAPAIGVAAAIGLYLAARAIRADTFDGFYREFASAKAYLASARPTAVNLFWALDRMEEVALRHRDKPIPEIIALLRAQTEAIRDEDIQACRRIGEFGLSLLRDKDGLLTVCNAGQLAAVRYGTALAPIYLGLERGMRFRVYACETRPLLQGARLTAFELKQAGVDTTLICDNMVSYVMKNGLVQAVLAGCDRLAANGDACNKIGTSGVAILASYYRIPFYVCAPTSSIDPHTPTGAGIPIEQRPAGEVTDMWYARPMAPTGIHVLNPAFDVTDHSLITAIITDCGILRPPYAFGE
ncbi:MAG: S-methyl-5-thioribose-1-phosphate isomerase [Oscillospiraceae bacterium]|nr:S-methyl-5-thioribose-1-phosphate isomerase [Oscillospiraceae bacterium]